MQIGLRSNGFDFGVHEAAQTDAQSRKIGGKQFGIADQREIGLQLAFLLAHIFGNGLAADFFFALDDELHIQRQLAGVASHQGFDGFDLHPELAFVVHRAAGIDIVVAFRRLKGRADPLVERIGRLHVVVRVAEHGRLTRSVQPVGVNQRMAFGGDQFHVLHADSPEFVGHYVGGLLHVGFMLGRGADAGNTKQIFEFV